VSRAFAALEQAGYVCQAIDRPSDERSDGAADIVDTPLDRDRPYHILARAA
jgi:hypothetical protein